jgi:hypothetical protein
MSDDEPKSSVAPASTGRAAGLPIAAQSSLTSQPRMRASFAVASDRHFSSKSIGSLCPAFTVALSVLFARDVYSAASVIC